MHATSTKEKEAISFFFYFFLRKEKELEEKEPLKSYLIFSPCSRESDVLQNYVILMIMSLLK